MTLNHGPNLRTFIDNRIFVDPRGITHGALNTYHHVGVVSMCGQLRDPVKVAGGTFGQLRVYANLEAPEDVDCMSCLVNRARLVAMVTRGDVATDSVVPMVQLDLRITSWA